MNDFATSIWPRLHSLLSKFAILVNGHVPNLKHDLSCTENDHFLLRAYLSFLKSPAGDELAITIDAQVIDGKLSMSSDLCFEGGLILATGPAAKFSLAKDKAESARQVDEWLDKFETFLNDIEDRALAVAANLS